MSTSSGNNRMKTDVIDLKMKDFKVEMILEDGPFDLMNVEFHGPKDSPYEDGIWIILVCIPPEYPNKPPTLQFQNKIFHPNIDFENGDVEIEYLGEEWSQRYDLVDVFEIVLPGCLRYPEFKDACNSEAASLLKGDKEAFEQRVREYCAEYAKKEDIIGTSSSNANKEESGGSDEEEGSGISSSGSCP